MVGITSTDLPGVPEGERFVVNKGIKMIKNKNKTMFIFHFFKKISHNIQYTKTEKIIIKKKKKKKNEKHTKDLHNFCTSEP